VASTLNAFRGGAVEFIDWLDLHFIQNLYASLLIFFFVADAHHVTISPGNSQTKCCSGLSKRLAEVGITIRKNASTLGFSSNPTKKVSSK
jgi:hypothetical protein